MLESGLNTTLCIQTKQYQNKKWGITISGRCKGAVEEGYECIWEGVCCVVKCVERVCLVGWKERKRRERKKREKVEKIASRPRPFYIVHATQHLFTLAIVVTCTLTGTDTHSHSHSWQMVVATTVTRIIGATTGTPTPTLTLTLTPTLTLGVMLASPTATHLHSLLSRSLVLA